MKKLDGRTYSLSENGEYYLFIAEQVDKLVKIIGGLALLDRILSEQVTCESQVGTGINRIKTLLTVLKSRVLKKSSGKDKSSKQPDSARCNDYEKNEEFDKAFSEISARMLTLFTPGLPEFLASLPWNHEEIFEISVKGYHLRMLHIEVLNRLMQEDFQERKHKVVILPHCLRDFRADECKFQPGDVDYICKGCNRKCLIDQSRIFLKDRSGFSLYVSQIQDLEKLFDLASRRYGNIGLLGVACVPELYQGMVLAREMGIPAQGVPLNYNRCGRWMGKAQYTNFNLEQLEKIINPDYSIE
jgi:hypothetical protein